MATYLPIRLPIFWEELRRRLRGGRGMIVLLIYTLILILLLTVFMLTSDMDSDPREWPEHGKILWVIFLMGQLVVTAFISPGLTAGSISSEREHETLELLLLTRMSSFSIVLGKFLGALGQMLMILLSGMPIIAVVFFFGGVSPLEVVKGYLLIIATAIGYASLGFFASCLFKRMASAVAWGYGFMLLAALGVPLGVSLLFSLSGFPFDESMFSMFTLPSPFFSAALAFFPDSPSRVSIWPTIIVQLVMATLILAECTMMVRRMRGLSKRFVPKTLAKPVHTSDVTPEDEMPTTV